MSASEIIGHSRQIAALQADIDTGNISHAYLFAGPAHLGKMTIARWFAEELILQGIPDEERQGVLDRMERLIHPDFLVLDQLWMDEVQDDWDKIAETSNIPQSHRAKQPKMKTDVIGIDDVRVIQERLQETGETPRRCCIIRKVERMRDEAANAFLKTLEEPPPGRVFILTTDNISSILPTVISRSRVITFHPLSTKEMHPLVEGLSDDDVRFLLHVALGAPGVVIRLRDDAEALRSEKLLQTQARSLWGTTSLRERIKLLEPLDERGADAERFLQHLALALRDSPHASPARAKALLALARGLKTNAHRELLIQRFAMGASPVSSPPTRRNGLAV